MILKYDFYDEDYEFELSFEEEKDEFANRLSKDYKMEKEQAKKLLLDFGELYEILEEYYYDEIQQDYAEIALDSYKDYKIAENERWR